MAMPRDAAAFCAAEYPRLVGALGLYLGDVEVAEDLAQEALLRACRDWERVQNLESPGGWTWRVAHNLANSHFRRLRVERRARHRLIAPHDPGPDEAERQAIRVAVAKLQRRQKTALVLRYYLGYSVEETASHMAVSADAVRSLTKRAIASLREQLGRQDAVRPKEVRDA